MFGFGTRRRIDELEKLTDDLYHDQYLAEQEIASLRNDLNQYRESVDQRILDMTRKINRLQGVHGA